ncbi:MAG: tripartite tricarboxylate transporter permease [Dehalococcoidales bacterium]|nr:tripartite tricarboxylate transporter permease [Dehalococcoidales bacterium]
MDALSGLLYGFSVALTVQNLLACFIGVLVGTLVGVLPGIGPIGAMALLIPATFAFDPTTAIIMMAGIYYGAQYGGSTTSILVNVPGEATTVITTIEGYQMAKKGRAGAALASAAVGSFVAGTLGLVGLQLFAPVLAEAALSFGPPEYFALTVLGLLLLSRLGGGSLVKAFMMVGFGLVLGTVGMEAMTGYSRFTLGRLELLQGIDFVPVAMGLFGIAEVLFMAEQITDLKSVASVKLRELFPTATEWARALPAMLRGTGVGFFIGLVPGPAAVLSTFVAYTVEKRVSRRKHEFGKGAIEGVAGPESANNAASAGAMVPLLALGIPFAPATAMLLGALMIHGVEPGPLLMQDRPDVFWGVVASMYLGNIMLLVLNLPLVGVFANVLRTPKHILTALIVLFCLVGTYSVNNSVLDLVVLVTMGVAGYVLRKLSFDLAPLVLALVLGPMMERTFSQSMIMSHGSLAIFVDRPITLVLLSLGLLAVLLPWLIPTVWKRVAQEATPSSSAGTAV